MAEYNSKVVLGTGEVLIDLTADTVAADKLLTGITAHGADGAPITGTCTFDSDTSEDTLTAAEAIVGKTFHARGTQYTGTMPNNGAVSGVISAVGTPYTVRSNAFEVTSDGGIVLKSPNGTRYKISVSDSGAISATAI